MNGEGAAEVPQYPHLAQRALGAGLSAHRCTIGCEPASGLHGDRGRFALAPTGRQRHATMPLELGERAEDQPGQELLQHLAVHAYPFFSPLAVDHYRCVGLIGEP